MIPWTSFTLLFISTLMIFIEIYFQVRRAKGIMLFKVIRYAWSRNWIIFFFKPYSMNTESALVPYGPVAGPVWGDGPIPVQWQSPGSERLPAQCTQLLCGGHVAVCSSHPHQTLCAQVLGQDTQSVAPFHPHAGTAGLRERPQPSHQT